MCLVSSPIKNLIQTVTATHPLFSRHFSDFTKHVPKTRKYRF